MHEVKPAPCEGAKKRPPHLRELDEWQGNLQKREGRPRTYESGETGEAIWTRAAKRRQDAAKRRACSGDHERTAARVDEQHRAA